MLRRNVQFVIHADTTMIQGVSFCELKLTERLLYVFAFQEKQGEMRT